jgi:Helix-loop-helix DNA-binding domain
MSPAMTPAFHGGQQSETTHMMSRETHFSPLASPAMMPHTDATNPMRQSNQVQEYMTLSNESMQEHYQRLEEAKMDLEEQLWKLKSKQPSTPVYNNPRKRPSPIVSTSQAQSPVPTETNQSMVNVFSIANKSPRTDPTKMQQEPQQRMSPATPASLMKMSISPTSRAASGKKNKKRTGSKTSITPVSKGMLPPQTPSPSLQPTASSSGIRQLHSTPPSLKPRLNSVSASPRTLKPLLTSPTMTPTFGTASNEEAARILAAKSNYQNLREGKTAALGISFSPGIHSGIEIRRSAHKAAEQKRRDNLKEWFDRLRVELEDGYFDTLEHMQEEREQSKERKMEDSKKAHTPKIESDNADDSAVQGTGDSEKSPDDEGSVGSGTSGTKQPMSKVLLLQYSYEYIVKLKSELRERDDKINDLESGMSKR